MSKQRNRVNRESLIMGKSEEKEKMFKIRNELLLHVKQNKNLLKNICHQEMYTYILLVEGLDQVAMYLPSTNKVVATNQRAN